MPKVPYSYEVNGKLVTGNGSLIPICFLSNRSLLPSLTVLLKVKSKLTKRDWYYEFSVHGQAFLKPKVILHVCPRSAGQYTL